MDRYYMPLKLRRVTGLVGYVRPTQELPGKVTLESTTRYAL
jgi:hypothetical protein